MIAVLLGLAAAVCNWLYLNKLASAERKISFIGINAPVNAGEALLESHFVKVDIPQSAVGNLDQVAPLWNLKSTVSGQTTNRSFRGGELVLLQDLKTPGSRDLSDKIGDDEVALWIPIDSRTFNSMRVNPGDEISFLLPRTGSSGAVPTPVPTPEGSSSQTGVNDFVGPFRILEIGSRTGRPEIQKASGSRPSNENVIAIVSKFTGGRLDARAERITEYLRAAKSQGLQVILHPKKKSTT